MKFGTDGVRGRAGKDLDANLVLRLAMAAGIYFRKKSLTNKILVGKDTRRSGYMIENALVAGLTAVGYDCVQIGPMPTPTVAFLTEDMRCDAGIMISASHNPYDDNGIKFFDANGNKLSEEDERAIEAIFADDEAIRQAQTTGINIGKAQRIDDVIGRYIVHIKSSFPKNLSLKGMRIVLDAANGAAYKTAPTIFRELGADLIVLNDEPNGVNINEECGAMHPNTLAKETLKYRADIGIALDGDADRLVVVDETGTVIDGDKLICALAIYLKNRGTLQGGKIAATVMSNGALEDRLAKEGIGLVRCNVGDKYVLDALQKNGLNFGGEQSGHIICTDYAKTGDGLSAALLTIAYILTSNKPASEALNLFTPYPQLQKAISVSVKKPLNEVDGLSELLEKIEADKIRHLVRYSGTENKIRLLLEGADELKMSKYLDELIKIVKSKLVD